MIPLAANVPLALCSVVLRRFIDSYTGRLPLAIASSTVPTASTVALFSGALVCLYHQLRKGTLVKIGVGKGISALLRNSRHTIQRRVKNNSWFLRNIDSCRRRCTEAVFKIVQPSKDSLETIRVEAGETGLIAETTSLPAFNCRFVSDTRRHVKHHVTPPLEKLYSNDSFESEGYSTQDVRRVETRHDDVRIQRSSDVNTPHRPLTRNFRKTLAQPETCGDARKLPMKRRRKQSDTVKSEGEGGALVGTTRSEEKKEISAVPSQKSGTDEGPKSVAKLRDRRRSDRLKKKPTVQKITRKTRSGRVYVYRL